MCGQFPCPSDDTVRSPEFWAQLGLVSSPALMARLGKLMRECSATDQELGKAMHFAGRSVERECSKPTLWATIPGDEAIQSRVQFPGFQDASRKSLAIEMQDSWSSDSSYMSSDHEGNDSLLLPVFTHHPSLVKLLPGMCSGWGRLLWAAVLAAGAVYTVFKAFKGHIFKLRDTTAWMKVVGDVEHFYDLSASLHGLCGIYILCSLSRLVQNQTVIGALRAELESSSGEEFRIFIRRAWMIAFVLFLGHHVPFGLLFHEDSWTILCHLAATSASHAAHAVWTAIFLVLWKLSRNAVIRLRDQTLLASMSRGGWAALTKEFNSLGELLYGIWTETGLSGATIIVLLVRFLTMGWSLALAFAESPSMAVQIYSSLLDASVICVALTLMANVSSRVHSQRRSKVSVLGAAVQGFGNASSHKEVLDHLSYVNCIRASQCGIECPVLGAVTAAKVTPLVRAIMTLIPACFACAVKLAHHRGVKLA